MCTNSSNDRRNTGFLQSIPILLTRQYCRQNLSLIVLSLSPSVLVKRFSFTFQINYHLGKFVCQQWCLFCHESVIAHVYLGVFFSEDTGFNKSGADLFSNK